jgi:ribosome-associated heat shock protein Hsp15
MAQKSNAKGEGDNNAERHRIDHWLKLCCVYKQRAEATKACESGHVRLNGSRAKPSAALRENDVIEIKGSERERKLVVLEFPSGSISKEQACTMYRDESPEPAPRNSEESWMQAALRAAPKRDRGTGRPTKRDRRVSEKFRGD